MTLGEARANIGKPVIYRACPAWGCTPGGPGVISSVNDSWVFVGFAPGTTPQACAAADLTLAEPDAEVAR